MPRPKGSPKPPTSGKKKGYKFPATLAKEAAKELVRQRVFAKLEPLVDAQIAQGLGLKYLVTREKATGKFVRVGEAMAGALEHETVEVWEKDPSTPAFMDLLNRAIGKPIEEVDLTVHADDELVKRLASARTRAKD